MLREQGPHEIALTNSAVLLLLLQRLIDRKCCHEKTRWRF
jgi:hypothetical protein